MAHFTFIIIFIDSFRIGAWWLAVRLISPFFVDDLNVVVSVKIKKVQQNEQIAMPIISFKYKV